MMTHYPGQAPLVSPRRRQSFIRRKPCDLCDRPLSSSEALSFACEGDAIVPAGHPDADAEYWFCEACGQDLLAERQRGQVLARDAELRKTPARQHDLGWTILAVVKSVTLGVRRIWR